MNEDQKYLEKEVSEKESERERKRDDRVVGWWEEKSVNFLAVHLNLEALPHLCNSLPRTGNFIGDRIRKTDIISEKSQECGK